MKVIASDAVQSIKSSKNFSWNKVITELESYMLLLPEGHVQREATQNTDFFLQRHPYHQKETAITASSCWGLSSAYPSCCAEAIATSSYLSIHVAVHYSPKATSARKVEIDDYSILVPTLAVNIMIFMHSRNAVTRRQLALWRESRTFPRMVVR